MFFVEKGTLPLEIVLFPFREIKKIFQYHSTYNKYQTLKKESDGFKKRLIEQEEALQENDRLRELLGLKKSLIFSSVVANVIGRDPSNWTSIVFIDKGKKDGLKQGMPVVNALGVIGKVSEVGQSASKVMLLNDPSFSVAGLIQRTRDQGLVVGTLKGLCRMRYLLPDAEIKNTDKVITSKLSSSFPEGLLIGYVIRVDDSLSTPTKECLIKPAVNFSQLEEVLVIRK